MLIDALKAITPPDPHAKGESPPEKTGRFRPYGGSDNWTAKANSTGEEDKDQWEVMAHKDTATDFIQVEAEAVAAGVRSEYETRLFWRAQIGPSLDLMGPDEVCLTLFLDLGYLPNKRAVAQAADTG